MGAPSRQAPHVALAPAALAALACAAGGLALASCYMDTGGLTGRGAGAVGADGGADSDSDAPARDAGCAGGDAAGCIDPCQGAILCDQFERDLVTGDWAATFTNAGGTVGLDTSTFTSPTRSLAIHVPTSGDARAGLASKDYPNVAHVRVAFAMKTAAPSRWMSLFRIQLAGGGGASAVLDLYMFSDFLGAEEQVFGGAGPGPSFNYPITTGFQPNVWQRWTMELDATVTPAMGILTLDGVERLRTPLKSTYSRGTLGVEVGSFYAPSGPARDVFYDDVSVTILP